MTVHSLSRWTLLGLLVAIAAAGCTPTTGPVAAPATTRPVVRTIEVPPPPSQADATIRAAWLAMLAGDVTGVTPPAATASAAGSALIGYRALLGGNLASAGAAFAAALQMDPTLAVAAYGTGLLAEAQQQPDVARTWFGEAMRLDASLGRAEVAARRLDLAAVAPLLAAADEAVAAGDVAGAVTRYRQASERAPWLVAPYRQAAELQQRAGDAAAAIDTLETARRSTGDDVAILESLASAYGEAGRWAESSETWQRLSSLRPDDRSLADMALQARRRFEEDSLPPEYRALADAPVITREQLAAVLAIHLDALRPPATARDGIIIADVGERWSTPFVYRMVSWGVMDVYQNNTFWPDMEVRRSMLVESAWRVLQIIGVAEGAPRARIEDPPAEHLLYRPVQVVVGLGLLRATNGTFELLAPVSGRDAVEVAERLATLVRERQQ